MPVVREGADGGGEPCASPPVFRPGASATPASWSETGPTLGLDVEPDVDVAHPHLAAGKEAPEHGKASSRLVAGSGDPVEAEAQFAKAGREEPSGGASLLRLEGDGPRRAEEAGTVLVGYHLGVDVKGSEDSHVLV